MPNLKNTLKRDYQKKALNASKDCISIEVLCNYVKGVLSIREKEMIEKHLAKCYHCLDKTVSIHDGASRINKRRRKLKKEHVYLVLAITCFVLSFVFSRFFLQFLTATIILGMKWIVDAKTTRMLVMIYEAYKKGGEREAGRILNNMERR